jgi:UDP-2-acetamido-2,6-beta-L-arabino-hexul-4-ose reductase
MNVLVTGAQGFIGKNLICFLKENNHHVLSYSSHDSYQDLIDGVSHADFIVHLAGVNRENESRVYEENVQLCKTLIDLVKKSNRKIPIIFSSSVQALYNNEYGKSKRRAEDILFDFQIKNDNPIYVYRLNNVFGKWCKPNYNSVIATFCYNLTHDIPVNIEDEKKEITFISIDDVCQEFVDIINKKITPNSKSLLYINKQYKISLGELYKKLLNFKELREKYYIPSFNNEFDNKLYTTYISYLPTQDFSQELIVHKDERGLFAECLKNSDAGQISINVIKPKMIKGNHYHHEKEEKYLVVKGHCLLLLRKLFTEEIIKYDISDQKLEIVDIPEGYTHSIENVGEDDAIVLMWSNQVYDINKPDTFVEEVIHE